jgi:hypothetical protein
MKIVAFALVLFVSALIAPAFAEEAIDGTKPLICATIQAFSCAAGEECERGLPESVGAPQFLRIDFAKKEIIGPKRTTQIRLMEKSDEQITLQGFELGMGWALALDRVTGKATITFAGRDEGFVIFGACTTP